MGDFLKGLGASVGYGADPNSGDSLEMYRRQALGNAKYDEEARARGFKSGDEMVQFYRNRSQPTGGTIPAGADAEAARKGGSMLHPANSLGYVLQRISEAFRQ